MKITTAMVKELRDETGAGVLDAKKALEAYDGDFEKALQELRAKGLAKAAKRAEREAKEGVIEMYAHPGNRVGVMLELNCETDFVGKNERFLELAHELALHIAAMSPTYVSRDQVPAVELERIRTEALDEGKPANIVEKIVSGRVEKLYKEQCLLEQPFVKDEERTVNDLVQAAISVLGENIVVRRFARYELGED
ncbi:MAG: translation elongation factor Ts [Ardenticatenaceae bacterium]|nr:translation elongation factor Ts [Anaerolineales bacterium]MCB8916381.1 translation elongation factor Ts [Ardenticatenaceae bacterium]